jgi:4-amino-4-deoxy-L-arabinose transferase-like glycosyltransferase
LAIFLLALVPRLWDLGSRPFWTDEVLTVLRAALPFRALVYTSFYAHHTPFYFLLVAPFAHSENPQFWLRLPSAVFGAVSVVLVYSIAARLAGRWAGVVAALILGLSPVAIAYSQEARSYTLVMSLILTALYGLIGLILAEDRLGLSWRAALAPRAAWLQFTMATTAAVCVLADSLPWLLVADIIAILMFWRAGSRTVERTGIAKNFIAANAVVLIAAIPVYAMMMMLKFGQPSAFKSFATAPRTTFQMIRFDVESIYLMRVSDFVSFHLMAVPTPWVVVGVIGAGLVSASAAGVWRLRRTPVLQVALLLAFLGLPLFLGLVLTWRPRLLLLPRYIFWSSAPFAVLAGIGAGAALERCRRSVRLLTVAGGAVLLAVNLLPLYRVETKPRWDIAARILAAEWKPGDNIYLFEDAAGYAMQYYAPKDQQPVYKVDWATSLHDVVQAHEHGHRVWAIYGDAAQTCCWQSMNDFRASLAPLGTPEATQRVDDRITIWRFDPAVTNKSAGR